jgi:RimJ/RimL family protein N-acetyltransferase
MKFKPGQCIEEFTAKNGKRVLFRTIKRNDVYQLLRYINTLAAEDTYILIHKRVILKEERRWVESALEGMKKGNTVIVVAEINGKIIGNFFIHQSTERSPHIGEFGIGVLKEYRNLGIGNKMMQIFLRLGKKMGYKHLFLGVFINNKPAIKLYKKYGFKEVARLPKFFLHKGKYVDDIMMMRKV